MKAPSLFLAHGAPDLPLADTPARSFTRTLFDHLGPVNGIVVVSAHWEAAKPTIGTARSPETIYDFGGFDPRLRAMHYPAQTNDAIIEALQHALTVAGIDHATDPSRGYDHGVWIPLLLARPEADLPVVQLSLRQNATAEECHTLGRALAPLRERGILIVGSGAAVHNLRTATPEAVPPATWATEFDDWLVDATLRGDSGTLLQFPGTVAHAHQAHPTPEHLMPFYVALGAGDGDTPVVLHRSYTWGTISMTSIAFSEREEAA